MLTEMQRIEFFKKYAEKTACGSCVPSGFIRESGSLLILPPILLLLGRLPQRQKVVHHEEQITFSNAFLDQRACCQCPESNGWT
jgi:hypothetical protein